MSNHKYKFGEWSKDYEVTKNWTESDYLINNQEIFFSKSNIVRLSPYASRSPLLIKYLLYGIFDLYKNTSKTSFSQQEILTQIGEPVFVNNKIRHWLIYNKYKVLVNLKIEYLITQVNQKNFARTFNNYDVEAKIKKECSEALFKIRKIDKYCRYDFYRYINLFFSSFVKITYYKSQEEYVDDISIKNKAPLPFYSLQKEGIKLMKMVQDENYLL